MTKAINFKLYLMIWESCSEKVVTLGNGAREEEITVFENHHKMSHVDNFGAKIQVFSL